MKNETESAEGMSAFARTLREINIRRADEINSRVHTVKPAAKLEKEREIHRTLKRRADFMAAIDAAGLGMIETNPKTGRSYSLPKVLADAVLRPRGERSYDVAEFQSARVRQSLSPDEREELEDAIRGELQRTRGRVEKCAALLASWYGVTPKWVNQYRIKMKSVEIARACRAGRAVLSYGMHGEKADSRTFHFVTMPESLRHESKDREPNWDAIQLSIFTKLAAHYSTRRGGRTQFGKDCAKFRRVRELIVSARPARGAADMTVADLCERLELGTSNPRVQKARMRERLDDGAAKLAAKRAKNAARVQPSPAPVAALVDLPSTLSERMREDDAIGCHTPFARACIRGDKGMLRRYACHKASWPLAGAYVRPGREELVALQVFMQRSKA